MIRSSNPVLRNDTFELRGYRIGTEVMTVQGVITKTAILLLLALLTAGWTWSIFLKANANPASVQSLMWIGIIGGLVMAVATSLKTQWAPYTAPLYAALEGLFIGGLSAILELQFPGIVLQAAGLTFATLAAMLAAYQSGIVRATENFKLGIIAATGGIAIVYLVSMVLGFFGIQVPGIFGNGAVGIGFSIFVCAIAAFNFIIDFDFIEQSAQRGAPKYMEWYGAFALMVTLVWLYIEFLRLLSKLRNR